MTHKFFFYAGLPRAGGTMLASVMNQHPDLHVTPLSPTIELLYYTEQYFEQQSEAYTADPQPAARQALLQAMPQAYYSHIAKPYIMDNNRAWPNNVDRIRRFITDQPRMVCIVRDIPSILASFVDLVQRNQNPGKNFIDRWLLEQGMELTTANRCWYLMQPTGIVNQSLWSMYQGWKDPAIRAGMHLVEYDRLTADPAITMAGIVEFLGLDPHEFVFDGIKNVTPVDDVTYNLAGMHSVRPRLQHRNLDPVTVLGAELVQQYSGLEYWRKPADPNKYAIFGI